jgi:hypothetical protein
VLILDDPVRLTTLTGPADPGTRLDQGEQRARTGTGRQGPGPGAVPDGDADPGVQPPAVPPAEAQDRQPGGHRSRGEPPDR